jgi:hypothetical protein
MNIDDEGAVLEILSSAHLPLNELLERTKVDRRGRVTRLRLSPCLGMDRLPSIIRDLSHLEQLYLFWGGRNLTCLPSELFLLPNLKVLHIRRCHGLRRLLSEGELCGKELSTCHLEDLIIEGCDNLSNLTCLLGRTMEDSPTVSKSSSTTSSSSSSFWPRLKHLCIADCSRANIVETFGGTRLEYQQQQQQQQQSSHRQVVFPSLLHLSLRNNGITGPDLGRLWQFFLSQCPQLEVVDLSDNQINTLEDIIRIGVDDTKLDSTITSRSTTIDPRKPFLPSLRHLNLAGNSILERQQQQQKAGRGESNVVVVTDSDNQKQDHLIRWLLANPQLCSIVRCESGQRSSSSTPTNTTAATASTAFSSSSLDQRRCFVKSALYSPKTQYALDLNNCSRGEKTLQSDTVHFPLAMWPYILQRANATVTNNAIDDCDDESHVDVSVGTIAISTNNIAPTDSLSSRSLCVCRCCRQGLEDCSTIIHPTQREASIIYTLLHGVVFASRWGGGGVVE